MDLVDYSLYNSLLDAFKQRVIAILSFLFSFWDVS